MRNMQLTTGIARRRIQEHKHIFKTKNGPTEAFVSCREDGRQFSKAKGSGKRDGRASPRAPLSHAGVRELRQPCRLRRARGLQWSMEDAKEEPRQVRHANGVQGELRNSPCHVLKGRTASHGRRTSPKPKKAWCKRRNQMQKKKRRKAQKRSPHHKGPNK